MSAPVTIQIEPHKDIYLQRYETYRHFDRLRWQILLGLLMAAPIAFAFGATGSAGINIWVLGGVGLALILGGVVMERLRVRIVNLALVLSMAGEQIGDEFTPMPARRLHAVGFNAAAAMAGVGGLFVLLALIEAVIDIPIV